MCETEDRGVRRQAFDFVHRLGARIVPEAVELLRDSRWYVVRNMLQVLQSSADPSVLTAASSPCTPTRRVRLEGRQARSSPRCVRAGERHRTPLAGREPGRRGRAAAALGRERSPRRRRPVGGPGDPEVGFGGNRSLRIRALRCLGEIGDPGALPDLKRCFSSLGSSAEERRAAYASLAGYPAAARAALVERGLSSRDPEVRALCAELARRRPDDE
ncbi:MAG: HEAT repeat domain-containing protein [Thermoanaerobaculia bacterium]